MSVHIHVYTLYMYTWIFDDDGMKYGCLDVWLYGVWERESAACVVQIKPMLAIWRVERETKEKQGEIDKLKAKVEKLESERDSLQESENLLSEKVSPVVVLILI